MDDIAFLATLVALGVSSWLAFGPFARPAGLMEGGQCSALSSPP